MSLPSINFLHLTVSEIQPGQTISRHPPASPPRRPPDLPDTMGENNTPTAIKGCGVKTGYSNMLSFGSHENMVDIAHGRKKMMKTFICILSCIIIRKTCIYIDLHQGVTKINFFVCAFIDNILNISKCQ